MNPDDVYYARRHLVQLLKRNPGALTIREITKALDAEGVHNDALRCALWEAIDRKLITFRPDRRFEVVKKG